MEASENISPSKKRRTSSSSTFVFFDGLPDDLVVSIISRLGATADCPAHLATLRLTCKKMNELGVHPLVLSNLPPKAFTCRAKNWSPEAHKFMISCVDAWNVEAIYTLGMIKFYCLENERKSGLHLIVKGALKSHPPSLHSLSIISFNGSGGEHQDLPRGISLTFRAAFLGHINALRELGHCLQDGYGVREMVTDGKRIVMQANALEFALSIASTSAATIAAAAATSSIPATIPIELPQTAPPKMFPSFKWITSVPNPKLLVPIPGSDRTLVSEFGCYLQKPEPHPANRFLTEWFTIRGGHMDDGRRLCSNEGCGRPETRKNEFRRCSACGIVVYCSRACQYLDWKIRHRGDCARAAALRRQERGE